MGGGGGRWIPAFAGMTGWLVGMMRRLAGMIGVGLWNDGAARGMEGQLAGMMRRLAGMTGWLVGMIGLACGNNGVARRNDAAARGMAGEGRLFTDMELWYYSRGRPWS